ncbi:(2Fe-2S)-binding protein [Candidatus Formimonas warabiya]|uniref:(2Fe-2S)-binding protein n=1 Tax=Formimonas warabiya TaxID=1761012 RepID=A0A3G1KZV7_FORW1|nr:(2Fe-2S)-binding protein [Candidatus Formimonas warabiya]ATW27765.1 (2Fe-2S)-binding protein [Candidatus Formimonas warabiya]
MGKIHIHVDVNGQAYQLQVEEDAFLVDVLRENLNLTGTKKACNEGECGACTVILNGKAVNSCMILASRVDGARILTIEGLGSGDRLHPIQEAFITEGAVQCGYCTPGMIMSAKALLDQNPHPSEGEIRRGLSGNLCRCTGYKKIVQAVKVAAEKMAGQNS